MTCADAGPHIDGFVDGELPPAVSIDVARHLSQCRRCDTSVQNLLAIRDALGLESDRAVASLDLSGVWSQVDRTITQAAAQEAAQEAAKEAWRDRAAARRGVPRGLKWGTIAAMAAGAVLFLRPVGDVTTPTAIQTAKATVQGPTRGVNKRMPNHVYIDRLAGKDIALKRESKSGTTMIWVNHEVESAGWSRQR